VTKSPKILSYPIVFHETSILPLIARDDVIFAIVSEFWSMHDLSITEVSFAFRLDNVFGYVQSDASVDRASLLIVELSIGFEYPDFVAEKSGSTVGGTGDQCLFYSECQLQRRLKKRC
jgi:hypothetical protein